MRRLNITGKFLSLLLIIGVAGGVNFAQQDSKASNQKLRGDVKRLTREVKASERGVYLTRFETDAEKT